MKTALRTKSAHKKPIGAQRDSQDAATLNLKLEKTL